MRNIQAVLNIVSCSVLPKNILFDHTNNSLWSITLWDAVKAYLSQRNYSQSPKGKYQNIFIFTSVTLENFTRDSFNRCYREIAAISMPGKDGRERKSKYGAEKYWVRCFRIKCLRLTWVSVVEGLCKWGS